MGVVTSKNETLCSEPDEQGNKYWAEFEADYFAEGAFRYAFRGTLHGSGSRANRKCVVKLYKENYARDLYTSNVDLRVAKLAADYANRFNSVSKATKKILFKIPLHAKMDKIAKFDFLGFIPFNLGTACNKSNYVTIEDYIEETYEKFNSNSGYVNDEAKLAQAFTHFTWTKSNKTLLICDLQGARTNDAYVLTDPAIHSNGVGGLYGKADLGIIGMLAFFRTHECNDFCRGYAKPNTSNIDEDDFPSLQIESSTSFTFSIPNLGYNQQKISCLKQKLDAIEE